MGLIPDHIRAGKGYNLFQTALRVLQFLSALISMALFSARIYKIIRLAGRASTSNGAVEGILVAAVVYTLVTMILRLLLKAGAPKWMRLMLIVLDIAFVAAFIVVAYLTRPHGGSSGPCRRAKYQQVKNFIPKQANCNLPWGTFILSIFSTILHSLTAIFHEAHNHYRQTHDHPNSKNGGRDMEQDRYGRMDRNDRMETNHGMDHHNQMDNHNQMDHHNQTDHHNQMDHHNRPATRSRSYEELRNGR